MSKVKPEFPITKDATITLKLIADSGYKATVEQRLSALGWKELNEVLIKDAAR